MTEPRAKRSGKARQPRPRQVEPAAALPLSDLLAFWREELPRLGLEYSLRALYAPVSPCPICKGRQTYRPENSSEKVACFCRLQAECRETVAGWRDYSALPPHLQRIGRADVLSLGRGLTPTQRVQLSLVLKAIDCFIRHPSSNQIIIGAGGVHGAMLAAYIAGQLEPLPNAFVSLRRLIDGLGTQEPEDVDSLRDFFYNIPVLIVDEFAADYGGIDEDAAQRLYDLVDYRWNRKLPVVIVSDVPLDQLWAIHPALPDRLQQGADSYIFDPQQIRIRRPVSRSTGHLASPAAPVAVPRCRWLSMEDGSDSSGAFPVPEHHCRRASTPQPIAFAHQASACLSANHVSCPVYQAPDGHPIDVLPPDILRKERPPADYAPSFQLHPAILPIIAGVVLVLVVGGLMLLSEISPADTPRTVVATMPAEPSLTLPLVSTSTSPPATPVAPTATATAPTVAQVTLSQETRLQMRPDADAPALAVLPAGAAMTVLGRDLFGAWLHVETADGLAGWVDAVIIAGEVDVLALPIYGEVTVTFDSSTTNAGGYPVGLIPTASPTPGLPATFTILLLYMDMSACGYTDASVDYTFFQDGNSLSMTRSGEGTVLTGSYDPTTGRFSASTSQEFGYEEISGRLQLSNGQVKVTGEHRITYYDGACSALWLITGQTLVN